MVQLELSFGKDTQEVIDLAVSIVKIVKENKSDKSKLLSALLAEIPEAAKAAEGADQIPSDVKANYIDVSTYAGNKIAHALIG